jgi:hypothetical protein
MTLDQARFLLTDRLTYPDPPGMHAINSNCHVEEIIYRPDTDDLRIVQRWVGGGQPLGGK